MASEMRLRPHEIMRLVQLDRPDRLLDSEALWLCLGCETCTTRCPNGCDPARVVDALRELALARDPEVAPKPIRAFHEAFLSAIESHGRLYELGLLISYKMQSGELFKDVTLAPSAFARNKFPLFPTNIEGVEEVRRIFEACRKEAQTGEPVGLLPAHSEEAR